MRNHDSMTGDIITQHSGPLQNVIAKHRKPSFNADRGERWPVSSSLAGKPQSVLDSINERVEVMRVRHEQGLDLWTGKPLDNEKGFL